MKTVTLDEFHALMKAQGVPVEQIRFRCPACGTEQCANDLIAAGVGTNIEEVERYLGFSCVGRWTHQKPPPRVKGTQIGCNWTLGGFLTIHELEVVTPDGTKHMRFDVCEPKPTPTPSAGT